MLRGLNPLYPLDIFYKFHSLPLPKVEVIEGEAMPLPYRSLLVGQHDMTPTLEAFHKDRIHLQVVERILEPQTLTRTVVLRLNESNKPVEFGGIVIHLELFPSAARDMILEGLCPLGSILAIHNLPHESRPLGYIQVEPDKTICDALEISEPHLLYGRRNTLWTPDNRSLADIVEILPL